MKETFDTLILGVRWLSRTAFTVLFLPGICIRVGLAVVAGRMQGSRVRCGDIYASNFLQPYRAGGRPISWIRFIRHCVTAQIVLGALLLAPFAIRAFGDPRYLIPANARQLALLFANGDNMVRIGGFLSRFSDHEFWRYWAGVSCFTTVMPAETTRLLARIEGDRYERTGSRRQIAVLDALAVVDDKLEPLGFSTYLGSGVLIAAILIICETLLLSYLPF